MSASESLMKALKQRKEQDEQESKRIDWEAKKRERLDAIDALYQNIQGWLAPAEKDGIIHIARSPRELSDPYFGDYNADALIVNIGKTQIEFLPEGQRVVGATARVDVRCAENVQTLVHFFGQGWKLLARDTIVHTVPLTADSFANFIEQILER